MTSITQEQLFGKRLKEIQRKKRTESAFALKSIEYSRGLEDIRWKKLRNKVLERDGHQCKSCGKISGLLQVHHRQYQQCKVSGEWRKPWDYHPVYLVTLCEECHFRGHQQFSIPTQDV